MVQNKSSKRTKDRKFYYIIHLFQIGISLVIIHMTATFDDWDSPQMPEIKRRN
jgi:hypothetical protein